MAKITFRFPPDAKIAVIGDKWYRDENDCIVAEYQRGVPVFEGWTVDELELCIKVLEVSERLSEQKEDPVVAKAMERFGARSAGAF